MKGVGVSEVMHEAARWQAAVSPRVLASSEMGEKVEVAMPVTLMASVDAFER